MKNIKSNKKILLGLLLFLSVGNTLSPMSYVRSAFSRLGTTISQHKTIALIAATAAVALTYNYIEAQKHKPLRWNWKNFNYNQPQNNFPPNFLWGTATSAHQVEGNCTNNSWSLWENEVEENGQPRVESKSGKACDHWNLYKDDIRRMVQLGVNAYRFSIDWSKIEPRVGVFNLEALEHYKDVCRELRKNGIQPCITLHHYTDPIWFLEKNGFEKTENIKYYVNYATQVIKALQEFDPLWFTFNSPDGYAAQGYLTCTKPAGRLKLKKDMSLHAQVYKNVLEAHVQTYHEIKQDPLYKKARIGILKNLFQLDPYNPYNPLDRLACTMGKKLVDTCFFDFFTAGRFSISIPFKLNMAHNNPAAIGAMDFVGINYYSHGCMKNFKVTKFENEETTDNERYTIYAEGLHRAINEMSCKIAKPLNIPMYVTENGIATTDANKRDRFFKKYLFALSKSITDGHDVRGYMYWSFMDNYEWGCYTKRYGLYDVNFVTQERTLKPGCKFYLDTIKANKKS